MVLWSARGDKMVDSKKSTTLNEAQINFLAGAVEGDKMTDPEESTILKEAQNSLSEHFS